MPYLLSSSHVFLPLKCETRLEEIDPKRKGYYRDLASRYTCEDIACALGDAPQRLEMLDLSKRGLTTLHHTQYFAMATHLNLSANTLRRVTGSLSLAIPPSLRPYAVCVQLVFRLAIWKWGWQLLLSSMVWPTCCLSPARVRASIRA